MSVQALCLDATGTLIETAEPVGLVYRRHALEQGIDLPAWRIEDAFRRILAQSPPRGLAGETPAARRQGEVDWWRERVRQTFQATDSTVRFPDFDAFARSLFDFYRQGSAWRVRPGVRDMLVVLRDRGILLAVVSDFDHRLIEILQASGLYAFFDSIWIPSETAFQKPDRRIFERAAARLGLPLGQLGYLGDDPPERLAAIARLGVTVFDVHEMGDPARIPDLVVATATLPPPAGGSGPDAP